MNDAEVRELVARVESLLGGLDERATEAVQALVELYGEALARFARTIFEQALNAQALRLAGADGGALEGLPPEALTALGAEDVAAAARALGETPPGEAAPRNPFRRRRKAS